jgi:hypothetical protein
LYLQSFSVRTGVREFPWALEVTQSLLDEGAITDDHVSLQLLGATMGMFAGAFEIHHVPWRTWYPNWFALCASLRNQGTARQYRLLQGKPKSAATNINDSNVVCPSSSSLERLHKALNWDEGHDKQHIEVYRTLMINMQGLTHAHTHTLTHIRTDPTPNT